MRSTVGMQRNFHSQFHCTARLQCQISAVLFASRPGRSAKASGRRGWTGSRNIAWPVGCMLLQGSGGCRRLRKGRRSLAAAEEGAPARGSGSGDRRLPAVAEVAPAHAAAPADGRLVHRAYIPEELVPRAAQLIALLFALKGNC